MPIRPDQMIVLAGVTILVGVAPALAHGSGSHGPGHSSLSAARFGGSTKSSGQQLPKCLRARDPAQPCQDACDNRAWCTGSDNERPHNFGGGRPASRRPAGCGGGSEHVVFDNVGRWWRKILNRPESNSVPERRIWRHQRLARRRPLTLRIWWHPRQAACSAQTSRPPHFSRQDHRSRRDQRSSTSMARSCRMPPPAVRWHRRPPLLR